MRGTLLTILMLAGLASSAMAQITVDGQRPLATREELERALQQMTPQERDGAKGKIVRQRLAEGDILPGDKIRISVAGDTTLSGTFTVRGDGTLVAPNVDPINVRGVLRSELEAHLAKELQKYLRNPTVTASSLVRIAVSGGVAGGGV
jgi:hypothetical protein